MDLYDRIHGARQDRLPTHVAPMCEQPERRQVARWIERKNEMGLPVQDSTNRVLKEAA